MERRFVAAWERLRERRDRGEPFPAILRAARTDELVAALAGAGAEDAVAANVIATELLNRERRAPFLGAFLVSATMIVAIYILDYVYTGTPLILDVGPRSRILAALSFVIGAFSLLSYRVWRRGSRTLTAFVASRRRSY